MSKYALLLLTIILSTAAAQETADGQFKAKAAVGLDAASGNSDVIALNTDIEISYINGANKCTAAGAYAYAETDREVSRQNSRTSIKYDRTLSAQTYCYARIENEYDKIALVDYRITAGPGAGVFIVNNARVSLNTDIGISYIDQKLRDEALENDLEEIIALRATERLEVRLSGSASFWQAMEYLPSADDFNSYLLNTETGLETKVAGAVSLRITAANRHNSSPPGEVEKDDFTLKAALVYSLGG